MSEQLLESENEDQAPWRERLRRWRKSAGHRFQQVIAKVKKPIDFLDDLLTPFIRSLGRESKAIPMVMGGVGIVLHLMEGYEAYKRGKAFDWGIIFFAVLGFACAVMVIVAHATPNFPTFIEHELLFPASYACLVTIFLLRCVQAAMYFIVERDQHNNEKNRKTLVHALIEFAAGAAVLTGLFLGIFVEAMEDPLFRLHLFAPLDFPISGAAVLIIVAIAVASINEHLKEVDFTEAKRDFIQSLKSVRPWVLLVFGLGAVVLDVVNTYGVDFLPTLPIPMSIPQMMLVPIALFILYKIGSAIYDWGFGAPSGNAARSGSVHDAAVVDEGWEVTPGRRGYDDGVLPQQGDGSTAVADNTQKGRQQQHTVASAAGGRGLLGGCCAPGSAEREVAVAAAMGTLDVTGRAACCLIACALGGSGSASS